MTSYRQKCLEWEELFESTLATITSMVTDTVEAKIGGLGFVINSIVSSVSSTPTEEAIFHFVKSSYLHWDRIAERDKKILEDISIFIPGVSDNYQSMVSGIISMLSDKQISVLWDLVKDKIIISLEYIKIRRTVDKDYLAMVDTDKWGKVYTE